MKEQEQAMPGDKEDMHQESERSPDAVKAAEGTAPELAGASQSPHPTDAAGDADLAGKVAALEAEIERLDDAWKRALAEVENIRRRAAREKADERKYAIAQFARDLLPVADNLGRALASVDSAARANDPALDSVVVGIEMTGKELTGALERHGITPIAALDQPFDPHVHEAMYEVENASVPAGTVVHVVEDGYAIHDRPLRPARVGVSKGGPKPANRQSASSHDQAASAADVTGEDGAGAKAYDRSSETASDGTGSRVDEKL